MAQLQNRRHITKLRARESSHIVLSLSLSLSTMSPHLYTSFLSGCLYSSLLQPSPNISEHQLQALVPVQLLLISRIILVFLWFGTVQTASKVHRQQVTATHLQRTLKGKSQSTPHHCHASPIFWERVCVCVCARALYRSATTEERYSISWQPGESMQEPYTVQFSVCLILRPADAAAAVAAASDSRHYNCCNMIGSTSKSINSDFQSPSSSSCNSSGLEFHNVFQYQIPTSKRSTYLHQTLQQERRC